MSAADMVLRKIGRMQQVSAYRAKEGLLSATPTWFHAWLWHEDAKMVQDFYSRIVRLWKDHWGAPLFHCE